MHVYIWAGGERVRRMHLANYKELMRGRPAVTSEELTAENWRTIDAFERSCVEHEDKVTSRAEDWRLCPAKPAK